MRARKVSNEEPKDHRIAEDTGAEGYDSDSAEVQPDDSTLHSTLDRVRPREDLRNCTLCGELDIPVESFLPHIRNEHRPKPQTVPSGYYGCLSGAEFWWPLGPMKGPCKWRCSVCGEVKWYWGKGNTHGGPDNRLADRRYGLEYCNKGRYPDHKRYLGKVDGAAGPVIFMHEGAPNPEQPVQDDPSLAPFIKEKKTRAKSVSNKADKKGRGQRSDRSTRQPKRTEQRARRVVRSN